MKGRNVGNAPSQNIPGIGKGLMICRMWDGRGERGERVEKDIKKFQRNLYQTQRSDSVGRCLSPPVRFFFLLVKDESFRMPYAVYDLCRVCHMPCTTNTTYTVYDLCRV